MKHEKSFDVVRFKNRNGVVSWRVSGWLHGVRIRKNFKTREEAAADKAAMELGAEQVASGLRSVSTSLSIEQVREAEGAFQRLGERKRSLSFYLDYALANYRDPTMDKPVVEAAQEYLALREADHTQGHLSHRQFTSFRCELRALQTVFRGKLVSDLTPAALAEFFGRGQVSRKSYNNRRGLIGVFLKYCLQVKDWIAVNPIDEVPHHRGLGHRRGSAECLSADKCAEIMLWAEDNYEGRLVPFVALCLFAGIRPDLYEGEISKLNPKDVRLDMGVIHIEPNVSKVRMKRIITIQPNLTSAISVRIQGIVVPGNHPPGMVCAHKVAPKLKSCLPQVANRFDVFASDISIQHLKSFFLRSLDPTVGQFLCDALPSKIGMDDQIANLSNGSLLLFDSRHSHHALGLVQRDHHNAGASKLPAIQLCRQLATGIDQVGSVCSLLRCGIGAVVETQGTLVGSRRFCRLATSKLDEK